MKKQLVLILLFCSISYISYGQTPDVIVPVKQTADTQNFLDLQANMYGDIFGNMMHVEEFKGIDDFMSLVNKMDTSPEMKAKLTAQYQFYDSSLDPKQKELAKVQFNELFLKAIKEGQIKDKQNP